MKYPAPELYEIDGKSLEDVFSPAPIIFKQHLVHNLNEMVRIAEGPDRLRPHCKTHKTREIIEIAMSLGIKKHKCATIAEAELLAVAGVEDILLAYQLVGPNVGRFLALIDKFPGTRFMALADSPAAVQLLSKAMTDRFENQKQLEVMIDLNSGMNRTGIQVDENAIELYEMIATSDGLTTGGLHWYDGHHRQPDIGIRTGEVNAGWDRLTRFRDELLLNGHSVPRIVTAGTGSFPILARRGEPNLELSPGTTVFHDDDMATRFPEMNFIPALAILTRVISCNRPGELTLDVGHKACAADQPFGHRLFFPTIPDAKEIMHSEEHLVIETDQASQFRLGDCLIAIPRHACPVASVHQFACVIEDGQIVDRWSMVARDRFITV